MSLIQENAYLILSTMANLPREEVEQYNLVDPELVNLRISLRKR